MTTPTGLSTQTASLKHQLAAQEAALASAQQALASQQQHYESQLENYQETVEAQKRYIQQLEEGLKTLKQRHFGASSEKNTHQLGLFNEAEAESDTDTEANADDGSTVVKAHTRQARPRISLPADLPREDIIHDLPEAEKVCPHDGTPLKVIGEQVHEQLDVIPAQVKVLRHVRKRYACPCCEQHIVTASKPKQPIEKSIASPGLLAYVATSKYVDALPLYRQSTIFERIGVQLNRSNLANWMVKSGELIQPLINLIQDKLREQNVLHMDETSVQVLKEPDQRAQSQSMMWVMVSTAEANETAVIYHYDPSRRGQVAKDLLEGFSGTIMVDGYEGYNAVPNTRLGCFAHARRKFIEAQRQQPKGKRGKADQALAWISKLYAIEKSSQGKPPDERYAIRQTQAKPILDKLHMWLAKSLPQTPPQSSLGKALGYLHRQWPRLSLYIDDGHYPIDNNRAENAIRPFVVGRKNWLFANSQAGAKASANLYSLIESAKLNGLEPYAYLKLVFTLLPQAESVERIETLLPWRINR